MVNSLKARLHLQSSCSQNVLQKIEHNLLHRWILLQMKAVWKIWTKCFNWKEGGVQQLTLITTAETDGNTQE